MAPLIRVFLLTRVMKFQGEWEISPTKRKFQLAGVSPGVSPGVSSYPGSHLSSIVTKTTDKKIEKKVFTDSYLLNKIYLFSTCVTLRLMKFSLVVSPLYVF